MTIKQRGKLKKTSRRHDKRFNHTFSIMEFQHVLSRSKVLMNRVYGCSIKKINLCYLRGIFTIFSAFFIQKREKYYIQNYFCNDVDLFKGIK